MKAESLLQPYTLRENSASCLVALAPSAARVVRRFAIWHKRHSRFTGRLDLTARRAWGLCAAVPAGIKPCFERYHTVSLSYPSNPASLALSNNILAPWPDRRAQG